MNDINNISYRTILRILVTASAYICLLLLAFAIRRELIWIGTAMFLAFAVNPAVDFFRRFMPRRSRGLAVAGVFAILVAIIVFLTLTFVPPVVNQSRLLIHTLPTYAQRLANSDNWIGQNIRHYNIVQRIKDEQNQAIHDLTKQSGSIFGVLGTIFSSLTALLAVVATTVFMLLEGPDWINRFWEIIPSSRRKHDQALANKMYQAVTSYVAGTVVACLLFGAVSAVALALLHVPFAIPLGILVAVIDLIPIVGGLIAAIIVLTISLFTSLSATIVMAIFFVVYMLFDNHVLRPIIYGRAVGVSPLLVLLAIIIGTASMGFIGALVAIPVAASLQIIVLDYVNHRAEKLATERARTS